MCGTQVIDTFTWGVQGVPSPQGCQDGTATKFTQGAYTDLREVPIGDTNLQWAACSAIGNIEPGQFAQPQSLTTIAKALHCPKLPPQ